MAVIALPSGIITTSYLEELREKKKRRIMMIAKRENDLSYQLYAIHALTGSEWPMISFVREYIKDHVPDAETRMDRLGNLYITKGKTMWGVLHLYSADGCPSPRAIPSHLQIGKPAMG